MGIYTLQTKTMLVDISTVSVYIFILKKSLLYVTYGRVNRICLGFVKLTMPKLHYNEHTYSLISLLHILNAYLLPSNFQISADWHNVIS